ncbi:DUF547 domain-containing protein [Mariniblastus sp.]|nr:DUF547 domain-containing protein [Mariniblastus sp.]
MFQNKPAQSQAKLFAEKSKLALLALLACFFASSSVQADEIAGTQWPASEQISMDSVNHKPFNKLLKKYVNKDGRVNYRAWHENASDRKALTDYLAHLSQANANTPAERKAKLAFWINSYNAVTIEGILRVYPTKSIRKHTSKVGGYNIWKDLKLIVGDKKINLEDIENKVLRKMNEPRIHFAIVCASIGCPRLLNEAYTPDKIEKQLVTNTKDFFSRSQNLQVDTTSKKLKLSKILEWYGTDFGADPSAQVAKLEKYWPADAVQAISTGGYSVGYLPYDWDLNTQ